jgi:MoaA/NifB/PqqE/SkfB family radical SAM enzyme
MPWRSVAITASGEIKPCCQWHGSLGKFNNTTISNALQTNSTMRRAKEVLLTGELPVGCNSCAERERMIGTSRRHWFTEKFSIDTHTTFDVNTETQLIQADINLSNVCNLKCRMCGSWASNQWFEEDRMLAKLNPLYKKNYDTDIQQVRQTEPHQLEEILSHTATLQRLDFKGGEPMMAKNHVEFLNELSKRPNGQNIVLQYTTNGTVVNDKILDALGKFKSVRIVFSIEGTGKLYQYIRGGNYTIDDLLTTISRYDQLSGVFIGFNVTVQAYNLLNLAQLHKLIAHVEGSSKHVSAKNSFNTICNSPVYLSPFVLPADIRNIAQTQLKEILDFKTLCSQLADNRYYQEHWRTFKSFTDDLDQIRGESVLDVIPELREYWYE